MLMDDDALIVIALAIGIVDCTSVSHLHVEGSTCLTFEERTLIDSED